MDEIIIKSFKHLTDRALLSNVFRELKMLIRRKKIGQKVIQKYMLLDDSLKSSTL